MDGRRDLRRMRTRGNATATPTRQREGQITETLASDPDAQRWFRSMRRFVVSSAWADLEGTS